MSLGEITSHRGSCWGRVAGLGLGTDIGGRWLSAEHLPGVLPEATPPPPAPRLGRAPGPAVPLALRWAAGSASHAPSPCGQGILAYSQGLGWSLTIPATWWYRDKIIEDKENAHGVSKLWRETRQPWYTGEKVAENVETYFFVPLQN